MPACYRHPDRETYIRCQRCGKSICPDCMREAAVGFQCPDCVSEGSRQTRSGRAAYGGMRPTRPGAASLALIGINVAVWVAILATGWTDSELLREIWLVPFQVAFDDRYYELITSAFTHVEIWHIGFNMLALWMLGPELERALGWLRFLALYLLSALAGSVCVLWLSGEGVATVGASGAIFGLMGGLVVIAHKVHGDISGLIGWIGANAVLTFLIPNVSWQGHLGGFVGGAVVAAILVYAPRKHRSAVQAAGLGGLLLLLAVAAVVRAATLTLV